MTMACKRTNQTDYRVIAKIISILELILVSFGTMIVIGVIIAAVIFTSYELSSEKKPSKCLLNNLLFRIWMFWILIFFFGTLLSFACQTSLLLFRATKRDVNTLAALNQTNFWISTTFAFTSFLAVSSILSVNLLGFHWGWMLLALLSVIKGVSIYYVWIFTWELKLKDSTEKSLSLVV